MIYRRWENKAKSKKKRFLTGQQISSDDGVKR